MYRCTRCRTAFVHPVPLDQELTDFYARYHLSDDAGGQYDEVEDRMRADFPAKLDLVANHAPGAKKLLDVGCGKGFFIRAAVDRGLDAQGIDLSESGVHHATQTLKVRAIAGDLHAMKDQLGRFEVVTFWATLEHLPHPQQTLRDIFDVLEPGGRVFLDTGIGDDWLDRLLPGVTQWYDPPQHLFVYSADGVRRLLNDTGFQLEHADWNFERSGVRRTIKTVRNAVLGAGLRFASAVGRMRQGQFGLTRYPVGNLMSVIGRKPAA
jgi:SAM-dependent methyltransferase